VLRRPAALSGPLAAVAAAMIAAPLAAQVTEFRGGGYLSGWTAPCAAEGWGGVIQVLARLRPAGLPGNSPSDEVLNLFLDEYTLHFRYPTANPGATVTARAFTSIGGGFSPNSDPMPRLRRLAAPEGSIWQSEREVAVHYIAEIEHFSHLANCRAQVSLWLYRR